MSPLIINSLQLVCVNDFSNFVTIRGQYHGNLKPGASWVRMPTIPGTLVNSSTSDGNTPPVYSLNIKFRVSYADLENLQEIEHWAANTLVARFKNGSGNEVIYGSMMHPCRLTYTKPEGFEGFECEIKGLSNVSEIYV